MLPTEDLGHLVVTHPSNEYFRNLLINTVSYDPVEITNELPNVEVAEHVPTETPWWDMNPRASNIYLFKLFFDSNNTEIFVK